MLFFPRTKTSVVYQWHCSWLRHLALYTDWEGDLSMIFLDTIMCICSESSSNGLPTLENSFFRGSESCWNIFSKEAVFLWCLVSCLLLHCWRSPPRSQASELFWDQQSTILLMLWDCQISQLPPPVPLTTLLFYSCAWSSEILENFHIPFCVVNWAFRNCS